MRDGDINLETLEALLIILGVLIAGAIAVIALVHWAI